MYLAGDSICEVFVTEDADTGVASVPDATPTAALTRNGADDGAVTLTVANIDTGRYKVTGTIPGSYSIGDEVDVTVSVVTDLGTAKLTIPLGRLGPARATGTSGESLGTLANQQTLLTNTGDIYYAHVHFDRDQANTKDEYTVQWFKNGAPVTSGITSPTIQVIKRADGTDLVAQTAMTQIGSTGSYKYDESTSRVTPGEAVVVVVSATIDAGSRTWRRPLGRDSA